MSNPDDDYVIVDHELERKEEEPSDEEASKEVSVLQSMVNWYLTGGKSEPVLPKPTRRVGKTWPFFGEAKLLADVGINSVGFMMVRPFTHIETGLKYGPEWDLQWKDILFDCGPYPDIFRKDFDVESLASSKEDKKKGALDGRQQITVVKCRNQVKQKRTKPCLVGGKLVNKKQFN